LLSTKVLNSSDELTILYPAFLSSDVTNQLNVLQYQTETLQTELSDIDQVKDTISGKVLLLKFLSSMQNIVKEKYQSI